MKKTVWMAALLFWTLGASAQAPLMESEEMAVVADSTQLDEASTLLRRGERNGELVLAFGGQHITLGEARQSKKGEESTLVSVGRHQLSIGLTAIELGFSLLPNLSYADYAPHEEGFMDLQVEKSVHVGFRILDYELFLNRKQNLSLVTGLNFSWDNYRFYNDWSLEKVDDRIEPVPLEGKKKSKLTTVQTGIHLGLKLRPARHVELTAFGWAELMDDAYTKTTKPKEKTDMRGLNHLRFGVQATATYHNLGVYVKYNLTPLFRSNLGPKCYPISVGFAWGF